MQAADSCLFFSDIEGLCAVSLCKPLFWFLCIFWHPELELNCVTQRLTAAAEFGSALEFFLSFDKDTDL